MENYSKTLEEFEARFSREEACRDYLFQLRRPNGFSCPRCVHEKACYFKMLFKWNQYRLI
ncbi:MAG: transposase [Colwellia sp.]|nr:transposase [Colwellia sp.]